MFQNQQLLQSFRTRFEGEPFIMVLELDKPLRNKQIGLMAKTLGTFAGPR